MPWEVAKKWLHPEGIFPAQLVDFEEKPGKWGPQVRWEFETDVEREDGKPPRLAYWTGMAFSSKSKLGEMLDAMGADMPEDDDEAAAFNPHQLLGTKVLLKVEHDLAKDGETWANIKTISRLKKGKGKPAPPEPEQEERELVGAAVGDGEDLFADE